MKLNDSEWTIMNAVWKKSPASARDVLEEVQTQTNWAYTTVKTLLTRLAEKGALNERRRANTSLYEPAVTRKQARKFAIRSLLDKAFDGAFGSLVQHLMAEERLSASDRKKLSKMINDMDRDSGKKR